MRRKISHFLRAVAPISLLFALCVPLVITAGRSSHAQSVLVGPRAYYLALGDSLAFGYQPNMNWANGYANYFYRDLKNHGVEDYNNLACPGETSVTMITGKCPYPFLRKYPYVGSQLQAAVNYLQKHAGQVSPVTLDIGANDLLQDFTSSNCSIGSHWENDLATLDHDLTGVILPQLVAAMTVNGQVTGELLLMNYYDPYQNLCPNTVSYIQEINAHLAMDAVGYAAIVDVFTPFGGATTPDPNICNDTWMCSSFKDIHAMDSGYSIMAGAFERVAGY